VEKSRTKGLQELPWRGTEPGRPRQKQHNGLRHEAYRVAVRARPERYELLCIALHGCLGGTGEYHSHTASPAWLPKEPQVCAMAVSGWVW